LHHKDLIDRAARLIKLHHTGDGRLHGDVGAVVLSANGNVYEGVCVDTASWGLCAERSAIAAMITSGEYRLQKVVAVWRNDKTGELHVLPPCGVCREFMRQIDGGNLDAEIVLGLDVSRPLRELLPEHEWPSPLP
jgi:cytidine deaminase